MTNQLDMEEIEHFHVLDEPEQLHEEPESESESDEFGLDDPPVPIISTNSKPNPFFVPINGSDAKYTKTKILAENHKQIYILCLTDEYDVGHKNRVDIFFEEDTTTDELFKQNKLVSLLRAPFNLINIPTVRCGLQFVSRENLHRFNHHLYQLNHTELVYLMLEIKESHLSKWLRVLQPEQIESNILDEYVEQKILSSYYQFTQYQQKHLYQMISTWDRVAYWSDSKHCQVAINDSFQKRKFNVSLHTNREWVAMFRGAIKSADKAKCYPAERGAVWADGADGADTTISTANMKPVGLVTKRSFYQIVDTTTLIFPQTDIDRILASRALDLKERYYLTCNLLTSKDYCHYIMTNATVLQELKPLFDKYKPIFRYLMGYAHATLYLEERVKRHQIVTTDRFVYDLAAASALPIFPFAHDVAYTHPYFSCLVSASLTKLKDNIMGVISSPAYQTGIVDLAQFRSRLNIFISDDSDTDLLAGCDWSHMVICGGVMAATLPRTNQLFSLFKNDADMDAATLARFFTEYYYESDIDIACNQENILDFIAHVRHIKKTIWTNLHRKNKLINKCDINIMPNKTVTIFINGTILKTKCMKGEVPFTYEQIVANRDKKHIKHYFYGFYLQEKILRNENMRAVIKDKICHSTYFELMNNAPLKKTSLVINEQSAKYEVPNKTNIQGVETTFVINEDADIYFRFSETLKFKIKSKYLKHAFELFRINGTDFFSCIAKFHLPCVRSYYNGQNCYLLPSAVTAYHTFTNIDFKYWLGSNDPIKIVNKYRMRGYGTVLNSFEIEQVCAYISSKPDFRKAYEQVEKQSTEKQINTNKTIKILGPLDINHPLFKPSTIFPDKYPRQLAPLLNTTVTDTDPVQYYRQKYPTYPTDMLCIEHINKDGNINPCRKWMIDSVFDLIV